MTANNDGIFAVLVDALPFDCDPEVFRLGIVAGVRSARAHLDELIRSGKEPAGASFAGLIFSPVASDFGQPLVYVNIGDSSTDRVVNGYGKVDWLVNNPDISMDEAVLKMPWLIGTGQFLYGHGVVHEGWPGAGSGLSEINDRDTMLQILQGLADGIRDHMFARIILSREQGIKWSGGEPREEYTAILEDIPTAQVFTVVRAS